MRGNQNAADVACFENLLKTRERHLLVDDKFRERIPEHLRSGLGSQPIIFELLHRIQLFRVGPEIQPRKRGPDFDPAGGLAPLSERSRHGVHPVAHPLGGFLDLFPMIRRNFRVVFESPRDCGIRDSQGSRDIRLGDGTWILIRGEKARIHFLEGMLISCGMDYRIRVLTSSAVIETSGLNDELTVASECGLAKGYPYVGNEEPLPPNPQNEIISPPSLNRSMSGTFVIKGQDGQAESISQNKDSIISSAFI